MKYIVKLGTGLKLVGTATAQLLLGAVLLAAALCLLPFTVALSQTNTGNLPSTVLPSASRSALTVNSVDQKNCCWRGGHFIFNVSSWASGVYTPHIQGKDPASGTYYDILVGPAITTPFASTPFTLRMLIYPGGVAGSATAITDFLPQTWRVQLIGTSSPISMSMSVGVLLEQ